LRDTDVKPVAYQSKLYIFLQFLILLCSSSCLIITILEALFVINHSSQIYKLKIRTLARKGFSRPFFAFFPRARRIPSRAKAPRRETSSRLPSVLILIRIWPSAAIMNFPARPDSSHTHSAQNPTQTLVVIVARQSGRAAAARDVCLMRGAAEMQGAKMIKYSDEAPADRRGDVRSIAIS
jgi:hypothetical protein